MRGVAFVALTKGLFALIDSGDRRAVGRHEWQVKLRPQRGTASGVKGVTWDKQRRRWKARISHGGRRVELKCSGRKKDAIAAVKRAARELHGEFARA